MEQTELVWKLIKEGDVERIRLLLQDGLNPNQSVSCYDSYLECAFDYEQVEIARLFIDFGTILSTDVMVNAARCADRSLFEYLLSKGADINAINHVGHSALSRALAFNNETGAYALIDLGIDLRITGENTLIDCAYDGRNHFIELLVSKGVDINCYITDSHSYCYGVTPLIAAVKGEQLETVTYFIQNGADTTMTDQLGCRAYNYSRIYKYAELVQYLKSHEPSEYHEYQKRTEQLVNSGLPKEVIKELGTVEKRIDFESDNYSEYLILGTIYDVVRFVYYDYELYNLVLEVDNYDGFGFFTWCPSLNKFVSVDIEHEWVYILHDMTWESFLRNPGIYIDRIINFEYDSEIET